MGICSSSQVHDKPETTTLKNEKEINLQNFVMLRSVGKGAFGKVRVCQFKGSNAAIKTDYALKYIDKHKCIEMRAVENIIQERLLLEEISCLFVCNLRYAFQDNENMFMVIDLMMGGDLRFQLNKRPIPEEEVRFWMAELCFGISVLHSRKIVHRDLKPDNILLCELGHAHLTDFNIATHYREDKPLMAVAGSMAYIAPEILERRGYLSSIDWWSLGVVMYEMVFQCRPFRSKTTEGLQSAILTEEIYFSSSMSTICSAECIDCIKGFLTRDITKRLGVKEMGGYETIKKHPFFKSINWDDLEQKKIKPPFVPEVKKTNFDASHELEELLSVNQPTQQIKRKSINSTSKSRGSGQKPVRKENSKVSQDYFDAMINLMNEKFTCYDFTKAQPFLGIVTESSSLDYLGKFGKLKASERDLSFDIMEGRSEDLNMSGVESNYSNVHSMNGSSSQNAQIQGLSSRSRNQSQKMSNTEKIPDLPNSELIQREKQGDIVSQ